MKLGIVVLCYFGGELVSAVPREDFNFTTPLGEGTMLNETYRGAFESALNFDRRQKLKIDRAKLFKADPDEAFVEASGKRIDLSSTGEQIIQSSHAAAPLLVLELFIVVA